jgi:hypothetical protein
VGCRPCDSPNFSVAAKLISEMRNIKIRKLIGDKNLFQEVASGFLLTFFEP